MLDGMQQDENRVKRQRRQRHLSGPYRPLAAVATGIPAPDFTLQPAVGAGGAKLCHDPVVLDNDTMPGETGMLVQFLVLGRSLQPQQFVSPFIMVQPCKEVDVTALAVQRLPIILRQPLTFHQYRLDALLAQERIQISQFAVQQAVVFLHLQHDIAPLQVKGPRRQFVLWQRLHTVEHDSQQSLRASRPIDFFQSV